MNINSGIYEIRNINNNHIYIGSSVNIKNRWNCHKDTLRHNRHHSKYLQRSWNKYGEGCFIFDIIMFCQDHDLNLNCTHRIINESRKSYKGWTKVKEN